MDTVEKQGGNSLVTLCNVHAEDSSSLLILFLIVTVTSMQFGLGC